MNPFISTLLTFLVKMLIDSKLFDHLVALVQVQMSSAATGDQKKANVKAALASLTGDLKTAFSKTSGSVINFVIESLVLIIKQKTGVVVATSATPASIQTASSMIINPLA
jgi:hypothetical protein